MDITTSLALRLIPERLKLQPVYLCIDDIMAEKFGKKFEHVSELFDHATAMIRQVIPALQDQSNVLLLFDSWYTKRNPVCIKEGYENLDIICNAGRDSVIYDLAPRPTGKRGRPAKVVKWCNYNINGQKSKVSKNGKMENVIIILSLAKENTDVRL